MWEVDDFLDRDLVLAEVELPSDAAPALPEWLAPAVVREVTGDPRYVDATLALARSCRLRGTAARRPARPAPPAGGTRRPEARDT